MRPSSTRSSRKPSIATGQLFRHRPKAVDPVQLRAETRRALRAEQRSMTASSSRCVDDMLEVWDRLLGGGVETILQHNFCLPMFRAVRQFLGREPAFAGRHGDAHQRRTGRARAGQRRGPHRRYRRPGRLLRQAPVARREAVVPGQAGAVAALPAAAGKIGQRHHRRADGPVGQMRHPRSRQHAVGRHPRRRRL